MEQLTLRLSEMTPPDRNIRIHTEKQLKEFERSVRMFGQIRPIVVDENNVILAGNGLYETLLRMGAETALVYRYTDLSEKQKKKLMIADNKVFSLGIENLETLNEFLEEMQGDLDIPGFDEDILKQMVADTEEITERLSEYGTLDDDEIQKIRQANERRESTEQKQAAFAPNIDSDVDNRQIRAENMPTREEQAEMEEGQPADVKKFVICPKCGEKIWL
jgi:ParB-like chromosome segregation protein Spo0J